MKFILLFLLIVGLIVLIVVIHRYKHTRLEYVNATLGVIGGGKTSFNICRIKSKLRQVYFLGRNRNIKHDYIILSSMPIGKYDKKHDKRYIKIFGKKIYCYDLDVDILYLKKRLPQDEVIIDIPEFHNFCLNLDYKNPVIRDNVSEFFANFRHYTNGLGFMFIDSQRLSKLNINIRSSLDYAYNMISCKKIPLLPITIYEFIKILVNENVANMIDLKDSNEEEYISKTIRFCNPFKYYNSHLYHERYLRLSEVCDLKTSKEDYRLDLFRNYISKPLYYDLLQFDFKATPYQTSKELYYEYCKGIK